MAGTAEVLEQLFEVDEDDDNDNVFHSSDESSDDDHFCPKAGKSLINVMCLGQLVLANLYQVLH